MSSPVSLACSTSALVTRRNCRNTKLTVQWGCSSGASQLAHFRHKYLTPWVNKYAKCVHTERSKWKFSLKTSRIFGEDRCALPASTNVGEVVASCVLLATRTHFTQVLMLKEEVVVKKLSSPPVSTTWQYRIWDNTTHVEISALHNRCSVFNSSVWFGTT